MNIELRTRVQICKKEKQALSYEVIAGAARAREKAAEREREGKKEHRQRPYIPITSFVRSLACSFFLSIPSSLSRPIHQPTHNSRRSQTNESDSCNGGVWPRSMMNEEEREREERKKEEEEARERPSKFIREEEEETRAIFCLFPSTLHHRSG